MEWNDSWKIIVIRDKICMEWKLDMLKCNYGIIKN